MGIVKCKSVLIESMPQYKHNTKQFVISVATTGGGQYKATVPKRLMESLTQEGVTEIAGRFSLGENKLTLTEEYCVITVDHLLSKWWDTHIPLSAQDEEDLRELDWDDLLHAIGVDIRDYEEKKPIVGDYDRTDIYATGTVWVHFTESNE